MYLVCLSGNGTATVPHASHGGDKDDLVAGRRRRGRLGGLRHPFSASQCARATTLKVNHRAGPFGFAWVAAVGFYSGCWKSSTMSDMRTGHTLRQEDGPFEVFGRSAEGVQMPSPGSRDPVDPWSLLRAAEEAHSRERMERDQQIRSQQRLLRCVIDRIAELEEAAQEATKQAKAARAAEEARSRELMERDQLIRSLQQWLHVDDSKHVRPPRYFLDGDELASHQVGPEPAGVDHSPAHGRSRAHHQRRCTDFL